VTRNAEIELLLEPGLVAALSDLVAQASHSILAVVGSELAVRLKDDNSPVTNADEASEAILLAGLARLLPGVPVISEESVGPASVLPTRQDSLFVLVDPLDGTRELVAGRDEYTVNVAVIVEGRPVLGIVAAPAAHVLWRGVAGRGAERLQIAPAEATSRAVDARPITTRRWPAQSPVALVSRSHPDAGTAALLEALPSARREACGSSVKFCRLAEGTGDLYPRLSPTSEWDIAAGHAVLAAAGGAVLAIDGTPLSYGDPARAHLVASFVALGDPAAAAEVLAAVARAASLPSPAGASRRVQK
jgi:3'(2'), 5'-bisphosphate nucleotidase